MKVTRTSPFTKVVRTQEINVTPEQWRAWQKGALIQNAMPHLTPDEREFILTGISPDEWDAIFSEQNGGEDS